MKTQRFKTTLKWHQVIAALLLSSAAMAFSSAALQPGRFLSTIRTIAAQPLLLLLNWLPCLLIAAFFGFLTRNVFFGASLAGLSVNLLSYINLLKIEARYDPLVWADIAMLFEGLTAAGEYRLNLHTGLIVFIILFSLILFLIGVFIKTPKIGWPHRISGCLSLLVLSIPLSIVYRAETRQLQGSQTPVLAVPYNSLGFNYSFIPSISLNTLKAEGFSKAEVEAWISEGAGASPEDTVRPHIIVVMCEAFSDLSEEDAFEYSAGDDPLYGFKKVCESPRAIRGHIVPTAFGGGTSETEFDFLTGMKNYRLSSSTITGFRAIRRDIMALPGVFGKYNYRTCFMHPGYEWFYNRKNVYEYMGIRDQTYNEAFDSSDYKGAFVSDQAFLDELKSGFFRHVSAWDSPLFYFSVTIQNHQSYLYGKYGFEPPPVPVSTSLSENSKELLSVYMEGVRDSSKMLLELTEYFDEMDEPVLLCFFGDHRPNLQNAYEELGVDVRKNNTPESTIYTFQVPFVIWQNRAYAKLNPFTQLHERLDLPENRKLSANFLGAVIYEITGMTGGDAFFDYLNEMRRRLPVDCYSCYCLPDGAYTNELPPRQRGLVDKLDKWTYYKLKHERLD